MGVEEKFIDVTYVESHGKKQVAVLCDDIKGFTGIGDSFGEAIANAYENAYKISEIFEDLRKEKTSEDSK